MKKKEPLIYSKSISNNVYIVLIVIFHVYSRYLPLGITSFILIFLFLAMKPMKENIITPTERLTIMSTTEIITMSLKERKKKTLSVEYMS